MFCPNCGAELRDGSVICNACGEHFEMERQRGRFLLAKNKTVGILSEMFHSRRFFVFCIFLSILCGASFMALSAAFDLVSGLTFAFSLVAMIACWQLYTSKSNPEASNVKKLRWLKKTWRIIANVGYIALIVALVCLLIAIAILGATWGSVASSLEGNEIISQVADDLYEEGLITREEADELTSMDFDMVVLVVIIVIAMIVLSMIIAFLIVYSVMLKKSEKYVYALEYTCATGEYAAKSCPGTFMMVMGIIYAATLGTSSFALSLDTFNLSGASAGLLPLATGAYLVCAGLLFNTIHRAELENNKLIAREEAELSRIAQLTNEAIREAEAAATQSDVCEAEIVAVEEAPTESTPAEE